MLLENEEKPRRAALIRRDSCDELDSPRDSPRGEARQHSGANRVMADMVRQHAQERKAANEALAQDRKALAELMTRVEDKLDAVRVDVSTVVDAHNRAHSRDGFKLLADDDEPGEGPGCCARFCNFL